MREYFRKRRAGTQKNVPRAEADRLRAALTTIIKRLAGNDKPMAVEVRRIAQEALGE